MSRYIVRFFGNSGVQSLDFDRTEILDKNVAEWVERTLPSYWPVYYSAAAWKVFDEGDRNRLIGEWKAKIVVSDWRD